MIIWTKTFQRKAIEMKRWVFLGRNWWDNNKVLKISHSSNIVFYCIHLYHAHCEARAAVRWKGKWSSIKQYLLRVKLPNYCNFDVDEAIGGASNSFSMLSMRWCLIWFKTSPLFSRSSLCRWYVQQAPKKKWFDRIKMINLKSNLFNLNINLSNTFPSSFWSFVLAPGATHSQVKVLNFPHNPRKEKKSSKDFS